MRDRQRSKVYAWERKFISDFNKNNLTENDCIKIFNQLQKGFNSSHDRDMDLSLRFMNGHGRCWFSEEEREVVLRVDYGLNWQVLLHEYSHAITEITRYQKSKSEAFDWFADSEGVPKKAISFTSNEFMDYCIWESNRKVDVPVVESHGGEFVANYSVLLHLFHPKHPSFRELAQSLRDANVDWSDFKSSLAWKVFRRRKIKIAEAA